MRTLLVVDDKEENRRLMRKALVPAGYRVLEVDSGEACLEMLSRERPDMVLMDLRLPGGLTGYETVRRIRELPGGRAIIVVAVSASPTLNDQEKIRAAGFDGFILKPVDVGSLPGLVAGYFDHKKNGGGK